MLILGQKSCFLGPSIFKMPQRNWYYNVYIGPQSASRLSFYRENASEIFRLASQLETNKDQLDALKRHCVQIYKKMFQNSPLCQRKKLEHFIFYRWLSFRKFFNLVKKRCQITFLTFCLVWKVDSDLAGFFLRKRPKWKTLRLSYLYW